MTKKIIEKNVRLSQSMIWELQCLAYCQFGIEAWSRRGVPSYITSNSFTAKCYAQVVFGFLQDGLTNQKWDAEEPVYFFDLGAGTGRFAYLFLKEIFKLIDNSPVAELKLCYVMTDIASLNIEFWQKHPYLRPYFDQGVLDCALYHHADKLPLRLICQQKTLAKTDIVNPIIVLANYFFDTLPQDLFRVKKGVLQEGRISLTTEVDVHDLNDPLIINDLKYDYSYITVDTSSYYDDPVINKVLERYRQQFDNSSFMFPIGAFHSLTTFLDLSNSQMLLLAGDQGVTHEEQVSHWGEPEVSLHSSFSIAVSYHAIGEFLKEWGGAAWFPEFSDPRFVVMSAIVNGKESMQSFPKTQLAFETHINAFQPIDYWKLVSSIEGALEMPPFETILLLIKLGNWDAICFFGFFEDIRSQLDSKEESEKSQLVKTIDLVWEHFYPVGPGDGELVVKLGLLLIEMKFYEKAAFYFRRAIEISGTNETAEKNLKACQKMALHKSPKTH